MHLSILPVEVIRERDIDLLLLEELNTLLFAGGLSTNSTSKVEKEDFIK